MRLLPDSSQVPRIRRAEVPRAVTITSPGAAIDATITEGLHGFVSVQSGVYAEGDSVVGIQEFDESLTQEWQDGSASQATKHEALSTGVLPDTPASALGGLHALA